MTSSVTSLTIDVLPEVMPKVVPDDRNLSPASLAYVARNNSFRGSAVPKVFNRRTGALAGAAIATVAGTSLIQLANQPAQYEGKFQLLVEPGAVAPTADQTASPQATLPAPTIDYATQIEVLWSPKLLAPVVQQLQTQYADINYETLAQKLEIAHSDGAKTLEVTYQDTDPQKVQAVLSTVSHAYLQYSKECRTSLCRELNFVEKRLPKLQKQVTIAQQNLQKFRQQRGVIEPMALGRQLEQRSGSLTQQRQDLQIRLTETRTQLAILQQRLTGQADATIANQFLQRNDRYQSLLYEFQTIADQLTVELARPNTDVTTLQALKQQYQQTSDRLTQAAQQPITKQLAQAVAHFQTTENANYTDVIRQQTLLEWVTAASQVQTLEISDRAIVQAEGQINQQIKQWAGLARQYSELNLELKFATDNLNLYQTKRAELRQVVLPKTDWQLTATPTVALPANSLAVSDTEQNVSLGLLLCFLLTILVVSVAEQTQPHKRPRRVLQPMIQPEYSWQVPEQPYTVSMHTVPALSERFLRHKSIDRTTIFLLTAALRIETVKRMKLAA